MSLWAVLITGLLAGGASCAAVQGGLLTGLLARQKSADSNSPELVGSMANGPGKKRKAKKAPVPPPSFSDDAIPVAMFLGGKLASHVALGAGLGLLGSALQVTYQTRAVLQIIAGLIMVILALNIFGVKWARSFVPTMPAAWGQLVRRNSRLSSGFAPGILGISTVLIPCGVTLSMELLAVASGSPLAGAVIMGTFVIGTAPLFAVLGYVASRTATAFKGKLALVSGVAVIVSAVISINAGLVLVDSPVTLASFKPNQNQPAQSEPATNASPAQAQTRAVTTGADGVQHINILVGNTSYSPSKLQVKANMPTDLTLTTKNLRGCTQGFVFRSVGIEQILPKTGATTLQLGTLKAGTYRYTCSMGMYSGSIQAV